MTAQGHTAVGEDQIGAFVTHSWIDQPSWFSRSFLDHGASWEVGHSVLKSGKSGMR